MVNIADCSCYLDLYFAVFRVTCSTHQDDVTQLQYLYGDPYQLRMVIGKIKTACVSSIGYISLLRNADLHATEAPTIQERDACAPATQLKTIALFEIWHISPLQCDLLLGCR